MAPSTSGIIGNATIWDRDNEIGNGGVVGPEFNSLLYPFDVTDIGALSYATSLIELKTVKFSLDHQEADLAAFDLSVSDIYLKNVYILYSPNDTVAITYAVSSIVNNTVYVNTTSEETASVSYQVTEITNAPAIQLNTESIANMTYSVSEITLG